MEEVLGRSRPRRDASASRDAGYRQGLVDDPEHLLLETAAVIERKDEQLSLVSQVHRSLRSTGWECTANNVASPDHLRATGPEKRLVSYLAHTSVIRRRGVRVARVGTQLRPSASPHGVLDARQGSTRSRCGGGRSGRWSAGRGTHADHGVLYGAVDSYQQATAGGLTPVIGMEEYLTAGSQFDRPPPRRGAISHNPAGGHPGGLQQPHQAGQHRLSRGLSTTSREWITSCWRVMLPGWWRRRGAWEGTSTSCLPPMPPPRRATLGDSATTPPPETPQRCIRTSLGKYLLRPSDGSRGGGAASCAPGPPPDLRDVGAPLLAAMTTTTPTSPRRKRTTRCCASKLGRSSDPNRFAFQGERVLREERRAMRTLFPDGDPGACDNTLVIAERAKVRMEFGNILLPRTFRYRPVRPNRPTCVA